MAAIAPSSSAEDRTPPPPPPPPPSSHFIPRYPNLAWISEGSCGTAALGGGLSGHPRFRRCRRSSTPPPLRQLGFQSTYAIPSQSIPDWRRVERFSDHPITRSPDLLRVPSCPLWLTGLVLAKS